MKSKQFNYAIGHYWESESGAVGVYTYGHEIFYVNMKDAKALLKYVNKKNALESKEDQSDYRIFQLIEVPQ